MIGEPDAGNLHVRFDEGRQETCGNAARLSPTLHLPDFRPADIGRHLLPRLLGRAQGCHIHEFFMDLGTPENYRRGQLEYAGASRHFAEARCLTP
jgi:NDP-sugar pyrophosphorylase family protein